MTWTKDALTKMYSLQTNCADFLCEAAEFLAAQKNHSSVQVEDLDLAIKFVESMSK